MKPVGLTRGAPARADRPAGARGPKVPRPPLGAATGPAVVELDVGGGPRPAQHWHVQHWHREPPVTPAGREGARPAAAATPVVQPPTVLLHGTGASVHSWRHLAPRLAADAEVLAVDLPGHGRSGAAPPGEATLPAVAQALWALLDRLGSGAATARWRLVGHSAGAAVAVQMALQRPTAVTAVFGINAALLPFRGVMGEIAPRMARFLARQPLVPHLVAFSALDPSVVPLLLAGTGSRLDAEGRALYRQLATQPRHVAGTLALMAGWDLDALQRALPGLQVPLHLLAAERDRTVTPSLADDVASRVPGATVDRLPGAGHLAHEEDADAVARWMACRA